jgi:hypothetical protein
MPSRLPKIVSIGVILAAYAGTRPAVCHAWSLFHPFSSDDKAEPQARPVARTAPKPPSTWDKITMGTKNFFNKTGEAIGLKKPEKKLVPQYASPRSPAAQRRQPESKSWFGSWFKPKEPEKQKSVKDWMANTEQITP